MNEGMLEWMRYLEKVLLTVYLSIILAINQRNAQISRSQQPRGLRRRSAAASLLRLWVRIPPGSWILSVVSVVCCQVEVSAKLWSCAQRSPTDCDASLCVIKKPQEWGGHGPRWAAAPQEKESTNSCFIIILLYASTCFEHYVFIVRRSKLYYTASCILTSWRWEHSARNM